MEDKLYLKRGLITQSLSPVFALLIIRHMHLDYLLLISRFFDRMSSDSIEVPSAVKSPSTLSPMSSSGVSSLVISIPSRSQILRISSISSVSFSKPND